MSMFVHCFFRCRNSACEAEIPVPHPPRYSNNDPLEIEKDTVALFLCTTCGLVSAYND
jgi:hypothetical protein